MVIKEAVEKETNKVLNAFVGKVIFFLCDRSIVRGKVTGLSGIGLVVVGEDEKGGKMRFDVGWEIPFFLTKKELLDSLEVIDLAKGMK